MNTLLPRKIVLLLLCSLTLTLWRFDTIPVGSFFDDAHYLVLAESLATGQGYRLINFPHPPVEQAFPPGWPLLLIPITAVFPGNLFLPKLLALAFWLASIPLTYRLFAPRLPEPHSWLLVALVAINPHLVGMAGTVMSEAAFLFFGLLTLNLLAVCNQAENRQKWWLWGLILVLAGFTMLIRTIGVALVLGIAVYLVGRYGRFRSFAVLGLSLLVVMMGLVWFNTQQGGSLLFSSGYSQHFIYILDHLDEFLRFWQHSTVISPETIANSIIPIFNLAQVTAVLTPTLTRILSLLILLLIAWGIWFSWHPKETSEWYTIGYLSIFYFWVVYIQTVQPRLIIPLIPFFYFYFLQAILWFVTRLWKTNAPHVTMIIAGVICVISLGRNVYLWLTPIQQRVPDLAAGNIWLQNNSPSDAVVMTANPVPDFLYLRRQTVDYPRNGEDINSYLETNQVNYVILRPNLNLWDSRALDPVAETILSPFLEKQGELFWQIYQNSEQNVTIYQVSE